MAKNRSEKSCYESKYGVGWITARNRLAEIICERMATKQNITLTNQFWMNNPWKAIYLLELTYATNLLKTFSFKAIVAALDSRSGRNIHSFIAPFLKPLLEIEQRKIDLEIARLEKTELPTTVNTFETPRPIKRAGRSVREKLADNGEETGDEAGR